MFYVLHSDCQQRFSFDLPAQRVFIKHVETAIASEKTIDVEAEARAMFRRQVQEWFGWIDHILDVHRENCVFRQPNAAQLEEHKQIIEKGIQICNLAAFLISSPFKFERDLMPRLLIRIRQLQDAYDTFHDETLSDEQAEKILQQIFPA